MGRERRKVFISYAREDETAAKRLLTELKELSNEGLIDLWYDSKILPAERFKTEILNQIDQAEIAVLLISPEFKASTFIKSVELPRIGHRHHDEHCRVLSIILKSTPQWESIELSHSTEIGQLQVLPKDGKPIDLSNNRDEEWRSVERQIRKMVSVRDALEATPQFFQSKILEDVGKYVLASLGWLFELEDWHHYYSGNDEGADPGLPGTVECSPEQDCLRLVGYRGEYKRIGVEAIIEYSPSLQGFSYRAVRPNAELLYRFSLIISERGDLTFEATKLVDHAPKVLEQLTLVQFALFLKDRFREQQKSSCRR